MTNPELQSLCEQGQQQLMLMDYLAAEATLVDAEQAALELSDFDTLARLYMPLQEARRQRRQRCGEGTVHLHLVANGPDDPSIDPHRLIEQYPQGQLLIAGWGTIEPAVRFRQLALERRFYAETYLAAIDPASRRISIVPLAEAASAGITLAENELPTEPHAGDFETYAKTMSIWERLHTPFLAAADAEPDPIKKMDAYRRAIAVDYACELAHQKLSAVARDYARMMRAQARSANLQL
jgi:hypothetical protein